MSGKYIKKSIFKPIGRSTKYFSYDKDTNTFSANKSELYKFDITHHIKYFLTPIYLKSEKTGDIMEFKYNNEVLDSDKNVIGWEFQGKNNIKLIINNK